MSKKIKVKTTVYPPDKISEEQWLKEFNVGKQVKHILDEIELFEKVREYRKQKEGDEEMRDIAGQNKL